MARKELLGLAKERIRILHGLAMSEKDKSVEDARRHTEIMENIARRRDITLPQDIKRAYCKKCRTPYRGDTRVRIKPGRILLISCGICGDRRRIPYAR